MAREFARTAQVSRVAAEAYLRPTLHAQEGRMWLLLKTTRSTGDLSVVICLGSSGLFPSKSCASSSEEGSWQTVRYVEACVMVYLLLIV